MTQTLRCRSPGGQEASLFYFASGQNAGVKIPLAFDVQTMKSSRPGQLKTPALNFEGLQATSYGLVIYGVGDPGFWVIAWSDIDAYRTRAAAAAAGPNKPSDNAPRKSAELPGN